MISSVHGGWFARALAPASGLLLGTTLGCADGAGERETGQLSAGTEPASAGTAGTGADDDGVDDDDGGSGASSGSDGAPADDSGGMTTGCVEESFFLDADGDGHGDPLAEVVSCIAPLGHVPSGDDCDDADATNAPSLTEFCDSKDNDCDGMIDEPPAGTDCAGCTAAPNGPTTYYFCPDPLTFDEARALCMGLGADLLKVDDQAEIDFLLGAGMPPSAGVGGYRNGLNDLATEGTFVWPDGSAPTFAPWNAGEPNDAGGIEDCVEMSLALDAWNDISCAEPRAYVCEAG
jgi:hypothetical protein